MKKIASLLLFSFMVLIACQTDTQKTATSVSSLEPTVAQNQKSNSQVLVAYFSVPETDGADALAGASRVVSEGELLGNTQLIAKWIAEDTGGDLFQIQTSEAYPGDHDDLVAQADKELKRDARPKLATTINNLESYDTILIGYPIWWSDMPMPVFSFFENTNFEGKKIIPFSTHGGSGMAGTEKTVSQLAKGAEVETDNTLTISRTSVAEAKAEVSSWVNSLGLGN